MDLAAMVDCYSVSDQCLPVVMRSIAVPYLRCCKRRLVIDVKKADGNCREDGVVVVMYRCRWKFPEAKKTVDAVKAPPSLPHYRRDQVNGATTTIAVVRVLTHG
jgi:hypothetical protein